MSADASVWHVRDSGQRNRGESVLVRQRHSCAATSQTAASTMTGFLRDLPGKETWSSICTAGLFMSAGAEALLDSCKCLRHTSLGILHPPLLHVCTRVHRTPRLTSHNAQLPCMIHMYPIRHLAGLLCVRALLSVYHRYALYNARELCAMQIVISSVMPSRTRCMGAGRSRQG